MKAYKGADGKIRLFRPSLNMERMNVSARRAQLPCFPPDELLECIRQLVVLDSSWVPAAPASSLYIRPALIATEGTLGLGPTSQVPTPHILSRYSETVARPCSWCSSLP